MQTTNLADNIFVCRGTNIPLHIQVDGCSVNTANNVLEWRFNESTETQYAYNMGRLEAVFGDSNRFNISSISSTNSNLNFTSVVRFTSDLQCTSLQCGSSLFNSDVIYYGKVFLVNSSASNNIYI